MVWPFPAQCGGGTEDPPFSAQSVPQAIWLLVAGDAGQLEGARGGGKEQRREVGSLSKERKEKGTNAPKSVLLPSEAELDYGEVAPSEEEE